MERIGYSFTRGRRGWLSNKSKAAFAPRRLSFSTSTARFATRVSAFAWCPGGIDASWGGESGAAWVSRLFVIRRLGSPRPPYSCRGGEGRGSDSSWGSPRGAHLCLCLAASCASLRLPAASPLGSTLGPQKPFSEPLPADLRVRQPQQARSSSVLQAVGPRVSHHLVKTHRPSPTALPGRATFSGIPLLLAPSSFAILSVP